MFTKLIQIVFYISISLSRVNSYNWTELDVVTAKLTAIGDRDNIFPENITKINETCARLAQVLSDTLALQKTVCNDFMNETAGKDALEMFKELGDNILCQRVKQNDSQVLNIIKEINCKGLQLSRHRDNIINAYVAAIQRKMEPARLSCYINKHIEEILTPLEGVTKLVVGMMLDPYTKLIDRYPPLKPCEWSDLPKAWSNRFHSIPILYYMALKSVLNRHSNKYWIN